MVRNRRLHLVCSSRKFDERGVEYVWLLQRALYGGPDAGRVWYNTYSHFLIKEETVTPFVRSHFDPSLFVHVCDDVECVDTGSGRLISP